MRGPSSPSSIQFPSMFKPAAGGGASPSIAYVQSAQNSEAPDDTTIQVALVGVGAGNLLAVWVHHYNVPANISVNDGNAYTSAIKHDHVGANSSGEWFYLLAATGGNTTITATFDDARPFRSITVYEYEYTGSIALDDTSSNESNGGGPAVTSGNITTTAAVNVALAGFGDESFGAVVSRQINGVARDHEVDTSALSRSWDLISSGTFTGQATGTADFSVWLCALIAFKVT